MGGDDKKPPGRVPAGDPQDSFGERSTIPRPRPGPGGGGAGGGGGRRRIGPFELLRALGAGGMGEVYEAIDTRNGQRVALKMLFEVDPAGVYRLKREFRRMADVAHENLISLYELHNDGTCWFFTMELLAGTDLMDAMVAALTRGGHDGLRPLVRQLVRGVHAIHQAGRIHRDLKPSNVMVTPEGRVVILDFGLVNEIDHRTLFASTRGLIRGTPLFMAPEQCAGQLATPAADWYAVGVILFAAVSGRYPFERGVMEIVVDKQEQDAPRLSTLVPRIPRELDDLVAGLLCRVPSERPGVHELLAWCAEDRAGVSLRLPSPRASEGGLLEREPQTKALREAFHRALAGKPTCVDVVGEAGSGKTALVRQFLAELAGAGTVVLEGVCSQRESVPFRAFDGLLDAITAHLVQLPGREVEAIIHDMGAGLYALAQIFPVLARVAWIAQQVPRTPPRPEESRRQAFHALKLLLFRIAERRPTVVFLDNLQWGDLDSARLLDYVLAPPDVPALLLILAYRRDAHSPMLRELALRRAITSSSYTLREVETGPLSLAAAARLAQRLLPEAATRHLPLIEQIGVESRGNPLLIHALAEEASRSGGSLSLSGDGGNLLARLVRTRLGRLSHEAREVFGRVVASSGPLLLADLLRAGGWEGDVLALVAQLRGQGLVRLEGQGETQIVVPDSEPIQEAAAAVLDPELLRRSHHELAAALILAGTDEPDRIARHLFSAGLVEQAYEHASSAAYLASKALAFDRAAELYELALRCKQGQWSLQKSHAEALVQAGRGAEAAPLFVLAAETAPPPAAARLRREAAEQFLAHGDLDRGMEILGPLLQGAGIDVPTHGRELAARLAQHTERLFARGYAFTERSEFELGRRDMERIDLCWTAGKGLLLNDPMRANLFLAQCATMALEAGEPKRVARYLGLCGLALSSRSHTEAEKMVAAAERLGEQLRDHYAIGLTAVCRGFLARSSGNWLSALTELDFGVQYLRENCPGSVWECGLAQSSMMVALEALGEFRVMSERAEVLLRRALECGDMHATLITAIYSALTLIAAGQPAQARARVREAFVRWPRRGFHVQHLHALKIGIFCDLYDRRAADAWQRIVTTWPLLESSEFLRVSVRRVEAVTIRAKAALAALRASPAEFSHLTTIIEQDIAQLEREGAGQPAQAPARRHLIAEAALLRAGLSTCRGDAAEAARLLDVALSCFEGVGMKLSAVAVRRLRGLRAGTSGAKAVAQADALLAMQNIKDGDAWLRVIAPGLVD